MQLHQQLLLLTTLNLDSNKTSPMGAQAVGEVLNTNSTLASLDLDSNSIWIKGLLTSSDLCIFIGFLTISKTI